MFYGLDAHKRFLQVCQLDGDGSVVREFRVGGDRAAVEAFAQSLTSRDAVALEATFHSYVLWTILRAHAGRVVVVNPLQVRAIAHARVKTDKVDAHILAQLLRLDFLPEVTMCDEQTWELRRLISHRRFVGKQRVATRNAIKALLNHKLLHCPCNDLFVGAGRAWLDEQTFSQSEKSILDSQLALHAALEEQLRGIDAQLRGLAAEREDAKLLMTIPGVGVVVALGLLSAIGDIERFPSPGQLASYFGLVPRVRQSADRCHHGSITKEGRSHVRWLAVEAAQSIAMSSAPLAATYHRVRRKKGHNVAVVAVARKLVVLVWHMLRSGEPYRYAPAAYTRQKLRRLTPGAKPAARNHKPRRLEEVYEEAGLAWPSEPSAAERRAAAANRRTITRLRKQRGTSKGASTKA